MNTTISHNGLPKFTPGTSNSAKGSATTGGASSTSAAGAPKSDDQVKLTDSALALQQAARSNDAAPMDSKRVEQVRQALSGGTYKIDASRIADRMLALDQQLGGTEKV